MNSDRESLLTGTPATLVSTSSAQQPDVENTTVPESHAVNFKARKLPQYVAAITATLSALSAGAVLGWTSPILSDLEHGHFRNLTVSTNQMAWVGSFVTLGGMTTCLPAGFLCDLIGRKRTLLLLVIPFSVGWGLILSARTIVTLYVGRLLTGMASGAVCVAAPLYTQEIAQKEIRGALGSYFQLMVTVGILFAYTMGKFLDVFYYTVACGCLPFVFFITFVFQPESPLYLLRRGCYENALWALGRLRGPLYDNEAELREIEGELKESLESRVSVSQVFRKRANVKAFIIAFSLMFFQQFSGVNAVILYTSEIFSSSGVNIDPKTAAIIVGAFQTVATFISSLLIDRLGSKILLFSSSIVMATSTLILAIFFTLKTRLEVPNLAEYGLIPVISLCLFIIMFSVGLGPIPWIMSAQIFSSEIKSVASSTAGTLNWFLAFLITKFYLPLNDIVGEDSTFYAFSIASCLSAVFVFCMVPEIKGKTVEEIHAELEM